MQYITTNIRLPKDKYFQLKQEAAKKRKSLAAIMREKMGIKDEAEKKAEAEKLITEIRELAQKNAKYTKKFDSVKALREIRYQKT